MSEETKPPEGQSPENIQDSAKAHIEKILKEKKNYAEANEKLLQEIAAKEALVKNSELERAKLKGDLDTVLKIKDEELNQYKAKLETLETRERSILEERTKEYKLSAVKKELVKMGADQTAVDGLLRLSNLELVKWDDDHKVALGVEDEAKRIKSMLPIAFGGTTPRTSHDASQGTAKVYDLASFKSLTPAERRDPKIMKAIMERAGIPVKP